MLAKESKIHNLILQREIIKRMALAPRNDGDPSFKYLGYVYPENREYFEKEGYDITTIPSKERQDIPMNIFTPFDDLVLTEDEEKTSKSIFRERYNITEDLFNTLNDIISSNCVSNVDSEESEE